MPIPKAPVEQLGLSGVPGARVVYDTGQIGRANVVAGLALQRSTNDLVSSIMKRKAEYDVSRVQHLEAAALEEWQNKAHRDVLNPEDPGSRDAYYKRKGLEAKGVTDEAYGDFQKILSVSLADADNDRQRSALRFSLKAKWARWQDRLQAHEDREFDGYRLDSSKSSITLASKQLELNPHDPDEYKQTMKTIDAAVGNMPGIDSHEEFLSVALGHKTQAATDAVHAAIGEQDYVSAQRILDDSKEYKDPSPDGKTYRMIPASVAEPLQAKIDGGNATQRAYEYIDNQYAEHPYWAEARRDKDIRENLTGDIRTHAKATMEHREAKKRQTEDLAERELIRAHYKEIRENPLTAQLPPYGTFKDPRVIPAMAAEMQARGYEKLKTGVVNGLLLADLDKMALKDRAKFEKENLDVHVPDIGTTNVNRLQELQNDMISDRAEAQEKAAAKVAMSETYNRRLAREMANRGHGTTLLKWEETEEGLNDYNAIQSLFNQYEAEKTADGTKLTLKEMDEFWAGLDTMITHPSVDPWFWQDETQRSSILDLEIRGQLDPTQDVMVGIGDYMVTDIDQVPPSRHLAISNILRAEGAAVNDENILTKYNWEIYETFNTPADLQARAAAAAQWEGDHRAQTEMSERRQAEVDEGKRRSREIDEITRTQDRLEAADADLAAIAPVPGPAGEDAAIGETRKWLNNRLETQRAEWNSWPAREKLSERGLRLKESMRETQKQLEGLGSVER